jgi:hypothetical protein
MWSWRKQSHGPRFGQGLMVIEPISTFRHFGVREVEEAVILESRVSNSWFMKSQKIQSHRIEEDLIHISRGR